MKPEPSLEGLLGRYELRDHKSNKWWSCEFHKSTGTYTTSWGAIGSSGQQKVGLTGKAAFKKIQEKIGKGYVLTDVLEKMQRPDIFDKMKDDECDVIAELRKIK